jgi:hypothetical protein
MNPVFKAALATASICAVAACAQTQPAPLGPPVANNLTAPALTAAQVRDLVIGKTGTGPMSGSHVMFTMYVAPDGTAEADLPTGLDPGTWHITDDGQWCVKWQTYLDGQESCQHVYPHGRSYKFVNATAEELLTFTPGRHLSSAG